MATFLKTLPRRVPTIIGTMLLVVSLPQLIWKSSEAEKYYSSARPLLEQLVSAQSGGADAPTIPVVEFEDRLRLGMSQAELEQGWSLSTLRRLVVAGLLMTSLGVIVEKDRSGSRSGSPAAAAAGVEPDSGQR
jgi:hypothetical protein